MKTLMPMIVSLLPLLALLRVMVGAGRAEDAPTTITPRPQVGPVELPSDSAILCPMERIDEPVKKEGPIVSLAYSADGKTLAAGNSSGFVKLFDPETGRPIASFQALAALQGPCDALAYAPDGRSLAAGDEAPDRVARLDTATGRVLRQMETAPLKDRFGIRACAFSPDGKTLAGAHGGGEITLWDAATGRLLHVLPPYTIPAHTLGPFRRVMGASRASVRSLAFSPDGRTLHSGGHVVRSWDFATGRERSRPEQPEHAAFDSVAISPDGKILAGGAPSQPYDPKTSSVPPVGPERSITLWDAATGRKLSQLPTTEPIAGLAFLPGGKALVALEGKGVARLWDLTSGHSTAAVRFQNYFRLTALAVSPDGRIVAAGGLVDGPMSGVIALMQTDGRKLGPWKPKP